MVGLVTCFNRGVFVHTVVLACAIQPCLMHTYCHLITTFTQKISMSLQADASCETTPAAGQVHAIHKYTETDRRRKKENKKQLDKEKKQKAKEEKTLRSPWYLDATPCPELDLTFRLVHDHVFPHL